MYQEQGYAGFQLDILVVSFCLMLNNFPLCFHLLFDIHHMHCVSGEHLPLWLCNSRGERLQTVWKYQDAHLSEQARPAAANHAGKPVEYKENLSHRLKQNTKHKTN